MKLTKVEVNSRNGTYAGIVDGKGSAMRISSDLTLVFKSSKAELSTRTRFWLDFNTILL